MSEKDWVVLTPSGEDDTPIIQAAINAGKNIVLSEGQYERLPDGDWCRVCKETWVPLPRTVCRECMGLKEYEEEVLIATPTLYTCQDCGNSFEPWRNGRFHIRSVCKSCLTTKRTAKVKATWAKQGGKKPGGRKPKVKAVLDMSPQEAKDKVWGAAVNDSNTLRLEIESLSPELTQKEHPDIVAEENKTFVPPVKFNVCTTCGREVIGLGNTCDVCKANVWSVNPVIMPPNLNTVTLDFSRCPWVLEWLRDERDDEQLGMEMIIPGNLEQSIVLEMAEKVPADWLKLWMLDRAKSA